MLAALKNNSLFGSRSSFHADNDILESLAFDQRNICVSINSLIFPIPQGRFRQEER